MKYNLDDGFSEVMRRSKKIRKNRQKKIISIISAAAVLAVLGLGMGYHILSSPKTDTGGPVYGSATIGELASKEKTECDIDTVAASAVRLEVYDEKDSKISTGTGFVYGEPAVIVTSAHVIVNMDYMIATMDDKTSFRVDSAAVYIDREKDIAMYTLPADIEIPALKKAGNIPSRGDPVITIGSQAGLVNLVTTGIVSGTWESEGLEYLIFTAPVSSGNSGGPLIDSEGNVMGVIIGTYDKAQNLNIALSINELPETDDI